MADEPLLLPDYELKRIMASVPAQHFVVAIVTEDHYGDDIIRVVYREVNVLVRRYDLDGPARGQKAAFPWAPDRFSRRVAAAPTELDGRTPLRYNTPPLTLIDFATEPHYA